VYVRLRKLRKSLLQSKKNYSQCNDRMAALLKYNEEMAVVHLANSDCVLFYYCTLVKFGYWKQKVLILLMLHSKQLS